MSSISTIRKEYKMQFLSENEIASDAIQQFDKWWKESLESDIEEVNAMTLATSSNDGIPSARIVLLKGYDKRGFVFFTNYQSLKGQQLLENPRACLVFFWKEIERQIRITGLVEKVSVKESDDYFSSRPEGSRIGAWASPQSQVIVSRNWLEENEKEFQQKFKNKTIPRPQHWGGYRVKPISIEFWQGRSNRLHDRINYTLLGDGSWLIERLAP
ncbi:MAG TPA: pyridoxamine 5'-phosphate oxidase [Puia sp.]|nr:pyridoxamine 5'-phosphate oxidase [Puia sp.]